MEIVRNHLKFLVNGSKCKCRVIKWRRPTHHIKIITLQANVVDSQQSVEAIANLVREGETDEAEAQIGRARVRGDIRVAETDTIIHLHRP